MTIKSNCKNKSGKLEGQAGFGFIGTVRTDNYNRRTKSGNTVNRQWFNLKSNISGECNFF